MHRILCRAGVISALATILVAFDANAFSISAVPNQSSNVTLVAEDVAWAFTGVPMEAAGPT